MASREYNRQYYQKHLDRHRERGAAYRSSHREELNRKAREANAKRQADPVRRRQNLSRASFSNTNKLIRIAGRPIPAVCDICSEPETRLINGKVTRLAFDHDHKTGAFRGWLCHLCNSTLGHAKDSPELLEKMATYLRVSKNLAQVAQNED